MQTSHNTTHPDYELLHLVHSTSPHHSRQQTSEEHFLATAVPKTQQKPCRVCSSNLFCWQSTICLQLADLPPPHCRRSRDRTCRSHQDAICAQGCTSVPTTPAASNLHSSHERRSMQTVCIQQATPDQLCNQQHSALPTLESLCVNFSAHCPCWKQSIGKKYFLTMHTEIQNYSKRGITRILRQNTFGTCVHEAVFHKSQETGPSWVIFHFSNYKGKIKHIRKL